MKINLIALGKNPPDWVKNGYLEYAKRLPRNFSLNLIEIPIAKRHKNANLPYLLEQEGIRMLQAVSQKSLVIALDEHGKQWTTLELAEKLQDWQTSWQEVSLLVGGPDGLSPDCLACAHQKWSLSSLTLPHYLVRILVAEQIYRAWTVMAKHPYHRD